MRLQIGATDEAWRTVTEFDEERRYEVQDAAASLSRACGGLSLRIVDDEGKTNWITASLVASKSVQHVQV